MTNLFFYGTLMHPEVLRRVVRGEYRCEPASLSGFARYKVRGQAYPATIEQTGGIVEGVVRFEVSDADVGRLDRFEGLGYERRAARPTLANGESIECQTYLCRSENTKNLTAEPWSLAWFEENGLRQFLVHYQGWSELE